MDSQPVQIPEKPKVNYWMISTIILSILLVSSSAYYVLSSKKSGNFLSQINENILPNTPKTTPAVSNEQTTVTTPITDQTQSWKTYKFTSYPLEFKYPDTLILKERPDPYESNFVVGLFDGNTKIMTIRPEQQGIGFENPDVEITTVPLMVDGKQVIIESKAIQKTKLYNKVEKTTTYIVLIQYPDQRSYSIMIPSFFNDNSENKQMSETFDRIISTIKFTN